MVMHLLIEEDFTVLHPRINLFPNSSNAERVRLGALKKPTVATNDI